MSQNTRLLPGHSLGKALVSGTDGDDGIRVAGSHVYSRLTLDEVMLDGGEDASDPEVGVPALAQHRKTNKETTEDTLCNMRQSREVRRSRENNERKRK